MKEFKGLIRFKGWVNLYFLVNLNKDLALKPANCKHMTFSKGPPPQSTVREGHNSVHSESAFFFNLCKM